MTKQKVEIELDLPDGYEATGEFREPEPGENFITDGGNALLHPGGVSFGLRIILRKIEPPEVQGPKDWPALKWAAKYPEGKWFLSTDNPVYVEGMFRPELYRPSVTAEEIDWTPPAEIADLPPKRSLVRLRHTCRWTKVPPVANPSWSPECDANRGHYWTQLFRHCPDCGREVERNAQ